MIEPMLVPTTMSGRMPRLSSVRMTPIWAMPFAPPPESTRAVRPPHAGRCWPASGAAARAVVTRVTSRKVLPLRRFGASHISIPSWLPDTRCWRTFCMTYVITEACIGVKDRACVDVCPVDCIYDGEDQLYIHPEECIDCGACEPECPVSAIFPEDDVPANMEAYIAKNKTVFESDTPPARPKR